MPTPTWKSLRPLSPTPYLDPAFRKRRPQVVNSEGRLYWRVEDQIYPRLFGRGCHNMGTPAHYEGQRSFYTASKPESIESIEISRPEARLKDMADEDLGVQVIYPSFFLVHPLVDDPDLGAALCGSYNRWLADATGSTDQLHWAAVVDLDNVPASVAQVREAKRLGAVAVMILGTVGERTLDHPSLFPLLRGPGRGGPDAGGPRGLVVSAPEQHVRPPLPRHHHPFPGAAAHGVHRHDHRRRAGPVPDVAGGVPGSRLPLGPLPHGPAGAPLRLYPRDSAIRFPRPRPGPPCPPRNT